MNRKKNSGIIAIIVLMSFLMSSLIPIVQAPNIQVSPTHEFDDAFITGIGAYFGDTPYLFLKEATQDITIGNRFRNIAIPQGAKINNATLFVRTIYDYPAAGSLSATIYGDDADNSEWFPDSSSFTRTYTDASVVWNISEVNGNQWHNVSITAIVQEIISRVGWTSGNDLSLIMLSTSGTPRREYASLENSPSYTAYIEIFYNEDLPAPSDQADPPYNDTGEWTWTLNDTYRGIDIWVVENDGVNRTGVPGAPNSVNWNTLNLTQLTEIDSGAVLTVNNETWVTIANLQAQQWDSLYNDTGPANIAHYFVRGGINVTAVTNNLGAGTDRVMSVASISTATPVGGGGLGDGGAGDWVGLIVQINGDDARYNFRIMERSGVAFDFSGSSQLFLESTNQIIYFEFKVKDVGAQNWASVRLYDNPNFAAPIYNDIHVLTQASEPFRYPQVCSSLAFGLSRITGELYTFLETPDLGQVVFISYPNGTLVDEDPLPGEINIEDLDEIEDIIDELLGGAQPEDPQEDEYPVIGKFQWKLLVLAVGMIMLLGSPIAGVYYGGDTATWIKILFIMFFGIGILWQIKSM